ncbi:MAG: IS3 family transposase [Acidobacteria bacterium]|nr:MAG: IS3 family transposase [Acidobacteriota bacterium]
MKFAFIHAEKARLPTRRLCTALGVSRSGYYAWTSRPPSSRAVGDAKLVPVIRACYAKSRATYGSPRILRDLRALDYRVGCKRVARLMRQEGLSARPPRRYRATTDSNHTLPVAPNVVARRFHADGPNRVWVTDMTYVWTWEGWLFLAAIVDVFSTCGPSCPSRLSAWRSGFVSLNRVWSIIPTVAASTPAIFTGRSSQRVGSSAA